jgi:hypothetical protein
VVRAITLEQTNAAITSRAAEISVEFAAKEAATKKLMAAERRAAREHEEKAAWIRTPPNTRYGGVETPTCHQHSV